MDHVLRALTINDYESSMRLGIYAFRFPLSDEEYENRKQHFLGDHLHRLGVFEGEQLCSQVLIHHMNFTVQGKAVPGGGVAFVSSWPEHRRKGYINKLMQEAIIYMKNKGHVVSLLHPFSVSFYRRYGYEMMTQKIKNTMYVSMIPRREVPGSIIRVEEMNELREVYEQYTTQFSGMVYRSDAFWNKTKDKSRHIALYYNKDGLKKGYMIYSVEQQIIKINEYIALDREAYDGLWTFIAQHDSMVSEVEFETTFEDQQFTQLNEPRIKREVIAYAMARIIDCEAFMSIYTFNSATDGKEERFVLNIEDKYAEWNNGLFELVIDLNGKAKLNSLAVDSHEKHNAIHCSINTLTALLYGYQTPEVLIWNNLLTGNHETLNKFKQRINKCSTYLMDFF